MASYDGQMDALKRRLAEQQRIEEDRVLRQVKRRAKKARKWSERAQRDRDRWLAKQPGDRDAMDLRVPGSFEGGKRR